MKKSHVLKTLIISSTVFIILLSLAGCFGEKEQAHDVLYYLDHLDEAKAKIEDCRNDVRKMDANYENAKEALGRAILRRKKTKISKIK